ncbi:MAG: hypothetical protein ACYSUY_10805, partial [Planctomycetota bacterium]
NDTKWSKNRLKEAQTESFSYSFVNTLFTFILAFLSLGLYWVCFCILLALIGFYWLLLALIGFNWL